jgi:hypothetical protein
MWYRLRIGVECVCVQVEVHSTDDLHVKINVAAMTYVDMHRLMRRSNTCVHPCNGILIQGQLGVLILWRFVYRGD